MQKVYANFWSSITTLSRIEHNRHYYANLGWHFITCYISVDVCSFVKKIQRHIKESGDSSFDMWNFRIFPITFSPQLHLSLEQHIIKKKVKHQATEVSIVGLSWYPLCNMGFLLCTDGIVNISNTYILGLI